MSRYKKFVEKWIEAEKKEDPEAELYLKELLLSIPYNKNQILSLEEKVLSEIARRKKNRFFIVLLIYFSFVFIASATFYLLFRSINLSVLGTLLNVVIIPAKEILFISAPFINRYSSLILVLYLICYLAVFISNVLFITLSITITTIVPIYKKVERSPVQ